MNAGPTSSRVQLRVILTCLTCGLLFGAFLAVTDLLTSVVVWLVYGRPLLYPEIPVTTVLADSTVTLVLFRLLVGINLGILLAVICRLLGRHLLAVRFMLIMLLLSVATYSLVRILHMGGPIQREYLLTDMRNYTYVLAILGLVVGLLSTRRLGQSMTQSTESGNASPTS